MVHPGQALDFFQVQTKPLGHATAILLVGLKEHSNLAKLDAFLSATQMIHDVPDEVIAILVGHDPPVQVTGLCKIIVGVSERKSQNMSGSGRLVAG